MYSFEEWISFILGFAFKSVMMFSSGYCLLSEIFFISTRKQQTNKYNNLLKSGWFRNNVLWKSAVM